MQLGCTPRWCINTWLPWDNRVILHEFTLSALPRRGIEHTPFQQVAQFLTQVFAKFYHLHQSFLFFDPELYASYISIAIFEYLNHPCDGLLIAKTFILQYQNNITNTESFFSTLPFCTWLKWLKILFSPTWREFVGYVLDTTPSFPAV